MEEREAYLNAFKEKTEKLKELNQQEKLAREKGNFISKVFWKNIDDK